MKVLSINGITKSGKTTTAEQIIRELCRRGYTVGSVKEIHFEQFGIDTEGTNTDRHRKAGASLVTARGLNETDVLYPTMLPIRKILSFYDHDYVILEGVEDINAPKIITAHCAAEIDERRDYRTFAVSGVIADNLGEYNGLPVINCLEDAAGLVDLIEEKVPHLMPEFDAQCCSACGFNCRTLLEKIIAGEAKSEDCVIGSDDITLECSGQKVSMVPFVKNILRNAVLGVVSELDGYEPGAAVTIRIEGK